MFKLSDTAYENLGHGIQAAFGAESANMIHFYRPDVLAAANSPKEAMDIAAPMPAPISQAPALQFPSAL